VNRRNLLVILALFLLCAIPANAYGDPTGGALFQILMPTLAAVWGMWLIFANRVRRGLTTLVRKLRGSQTEEST
jgi:hypothetical protein